MTTVSRLHVTPLDQTILPIVLPASLRGQASEISFHTVTTFPEAKYGFFTVPTSEAQRIQKKFHGSILKGCKMKVEVARPRRSAHDVTHPEDPVQTPVKNTRSRQSAVSQKGTFPGIEIPSERKVKRGWTGAKESPEQKSTESKRTRKSFTSPETSRDEDTKCLFVAKLPQHDTQKKRKRTRDQKTIVPEFKNTVIVTTSETDQSDVKPASEYVDGTGWVDETGELVEAVRTRGHVSSVASKAASVATPEVSGLASGDRPDLSAAGSDDDLQDDIQIPAKASSHASGQKTKIRRSLRRPLEPDPDTAGDDEIQTAEVERLSISRSSGSPMPHVDSQPTSAPSSQVHPLEAFFKRPQAAASQSHTPKKPHLEVSTSFTFFGSDQDMPSNEDSHMLLPQTPFTQQDFRHRRQRSAAPTPDTALPGKTFGDSLGKGNSASESDGKSLSNDSVASEAEATDVASADGKGNSGPKDESEGAKWFYEHRGETNRSWKRRKREATKEKKLRERRAKR